MADFCFCRKCGADLRGPAIALENIESYGGHVDCRDGCGAASHYSRLVGIYDRGKDRTVAWMCPDCKHTEPRQTD